MQTRHLGSSNLQIPVITLGTMTWGQQNSETQAHEQLNYAVEERGLYFIDTAEMYPVPPRADKQGLTETYIGNWLAKRGQRDDLLIASKVSPSPLIRTRDLRGEPKLDRQSIREAVEGSLKRLQTDYLDLYQIHWPVRQTNFFGVRGYVHPDQDNSTPILETLQALGEIVKEGKVRHIGVSNETPWGVMEYLNLAKEHNLPRLVSIQNQYSLVNRTYEIGLAEISIKEEIALLAYSALNMGALTGKHLNGAAPDTRFSHPDFTDQNKQRYNPARAQKAYARYVELAKDHNLDPAAMAIAFAVDRQFMTSVIIGATTMDQLKTCIDAGELALSAEVLDGIEAVHNDFPDVTH